MPMRTKRSNDMRVVCLECISERHIKKWKTQPPYGCNRSGQVKLVGPIAGAIAALGYLNDSSHVFFRLPCNQAKAVITFLDAASEKTLRSTVALTAARGRGKSAALGVAIAGAVALGYSNIFVTSPSPENLKTLFEFVFKGFDAMDYKVRFSLLCSREIEDVISLLGKEGLHLV
jgi:hypothetical protein